MFDHDKTLCAEFQALLTNFASYRAARARYQHDLVFDKIFDRLGVEVFWLASEQILDRYVADLFALILQKRKELNIL